MGGNMPIPPSPILPGRCPEVNYQSPGRKGQEGKALESGQTQAHLNRGGLDYLLLLRNQRNKFILHLTSPDSQLHERKEEHAAG